jgi:lipopolysaccharide/colanic/teichoic acid biosynthesis glycosyltransferase
MTRDYMVAIEDGAGMTDDVAVSGFGLPLAPLTPGQWTRVRRLLRPTTASFTSPRTRILDRIVAALVFVAATPLLALAALLVFIESPGTVLVRQVRIGAGGAPFRIIKLRTMRRDAASTLEAVAEADNVHALLGDDRMFKAWADPRVLKVGALLRALAIDELPQLVNVVGGDMALVGPRPLTPDEDGWVSGPALARREVPPGITGLWQVVGGNEIGFGGMVFLDALYVGHRSLAQDLRLLAATPRAIGRDLRAWRRGSTG